METLYLGGYTRSENKGIHTLELMDDGTFGDHRLIIEESNPTYFALSRDQKHLFTLSQSNDQPGVVHYQKKDTHFEFVDRVAFLNANGCYLALDEERQLIYTANYHDGKLAVIKIEADGTLTLMNITSHLGHGATERQESAHCHFIDLTPDGYLISCDLGTDEVSTYELTADNNLQLKDTYHAEAGTGARHLTFHPDGRIAYVIGELSNTVDVCDYADGHLTLIERHSTIDATEQFAGSAAIRVSSDGQFLYTSTRGTDELTIFAISEDGAHLSRIQNISTGGQSPRDFNFNQNEDFIIVGHQDSANITLFERDKQSGTLTALPAHAAIPEIVCIKHS